MCQKVVFIEKKMLYLQFPDTAICNAQMCSSCDTAKSHPHPGSWRGSWPFLSKFVSW